ncbi:dynamin-like protein, putative [Eimeria tenella]|uniref:Dynamin-like protein, putative n=1 Tax=Eimeria tenella TaxID=5802 RepID=U6L6R3_EIMTE|nr:dynamin-like protein, putative [Eimeria tenella]CDJ43455.1 dynamin-like protein, putative [Eimeria tenella]|eukprot:XP_013234205.1 dynamin-like protein, putative [Eimeria tenella]
MEQLIPIMNRLQDALLTLGSADGTTFDLPQIAVVGAQSVGKSSVLEAVIGKDFLPRGAGIVTRRPLILQLQHTAGTAEWGEFSHSPGHRFTDFAQIRREIERETERVTGRSKNISPIPICLKIFSPNVIDLTLVDLPGITKVPVGDQPSDIELQIRKIVLQYISQPSCVILAITAANTDIANSDSLKIAREADPEGRRTIGVVTKVDTMEEGADCADVLLGKVYPLRRGFVGVVCRSLAQTREQLSPRAVQEEEAKFFQNHPAYKVLMQHIRESLPELRERLQKRLQEAEAELAGYGDPLLEVKGNAGALLLHFFSKFARNFQDAIDGKLQSQHSSDHLMGGARINFIFHDWYGRALAEFDPLSGLTDHEIRTAIRNATGPKAALFVPESAFEILVKKQIQQLESPSLLCVEQVYDELQKIVEKSELPEMSRFTNLRDRILEVVCGVLKRCLAPTNQMIHNIIQIELAYINTNHPDFMSNKALPGLFGDNASGRRDSCSPGLGSSLQPPQHQQQPSGKPAAPADKDLPPSPRGEFGVGGVLQQGGFFSFLKNSRPSPHGGRHNAANMVQPAPQQPQQMLHPSMQQPHPQRSDMANTAERFTAEPRLTATFDKLRGGGGIRMPAVPPVVAPSDTPSDREQIETELIKSLLWSYFQIVRKNVADAVPKAIMYFMVNTAKDVLQRELVAQLYREELFGELMKEAGDISAKRQQCKQLLKSIRSALDIVSNVRELGSEDGLPSRRPF